MKTNEKYPTLFFLKKHTYIQIFKSNNEGG